MGALSRSGANAPSWVDNVVRRREFEAANPDVTISFEKQAACGADWGRWTGVIVVGDEERTVSARDLGALLSRLEPLAAERRALASLNRHGPVTKL